MKIVTGKVQKDGSIRLLFDKKGEVIYPEDIQQTLKFRGKIIHAYGVVSKERISGSLEMTFIKIKKIKPVF